MFPGVIVLGVGILSGCGDGPLSTEDVGPQFSLGDPNCPTKIKDMTGEEAKNCTDRSDRYGDVRGMESDIRLEDEFCREVWDRLGRLMNNGRVRGYDHSYAGWWEGTRSINDAIWVANFLWDNPAYTRGLLGTLMHEAGHSLHGAGHGSWSEQVEDCYAA